MYLLTVNTVQLMNYKIKLYNFVTSLIILMIDCRKKKILEINCLKLIFNFTIAIKIKIKATT